MILHVILFMQVRKAKLLEHVRNNPANVRFSDLCKLAEDFGFRLRGSRGSHRIYTRQEVRELLNFQNVGGKAKPYQVRQVRDVVLKHRLGEQDDEV